MSRSTPSPRRAPAVQHDGGVLVGTRRTSRGLQGGPPPPRRSTCMASRPRLAAAVRALARACRPPSTGEWEDRLIHPVAPCSVARHGRTAPLDARRPRARGRQAQALRRPRERTAPPSTCGKVTVSRDIHQGCDDVGWLGSSPSKPRWGARLRVCIPDAGEERLSGSGSTVLAQETRNLSTDAQNGSVLRALASASIAMGEPSLASALAADSTDDAGIPLEEAIRSFRRASIVMFDKVGSGVPRPGSAKPPSG